MKPLTEKGVTQIEFFNSMSIYTYRRYKQLKYNDKLDTKNHIIKTGSSRRK